jgi:hypothetical protein
MVYAQACTLCEYEQDSSEDDLEDKIHTCIYSTYFIIKMRN